MTDTKTTKTLAEVRKAREENMPKLFNMACALKAIEDTKPVVRAGHNSDFTKELTELFEQAGKELAINQVVAAFKAGGREVTPKQVADRCWLLAKRGVLVKGSMKGTYKIADK